MLLICLADADDVIVQCWCSRTPCQHMLAANPLDGLAHHRRRAEVDEAVGEIAHGRIRRNARRSIAAATLDAQQQLANGELFLLLCPSLGRHDACRAYGLFDGLQRAAFLLDAK